MCILPFSASGTEMISRPCRYAGKIPLEMV